VIDASSAVSVGGKIKLVDVSKMMACIGHIEKPSPAFRGCQILGKIVFVP
jgi:hypothetical protein